MLRWHTRDLSIFGVRFCACYQLPLALPGAKTGGGEASVLRKDKRLVGLDVATGNVWQAQIAA